MPDSPKIWGTLELEKQGDQLQTHLQAMAHFCSDPRETRAGRRPRSDARGKSTHQCIVSTLTPRIPASMQLRLSC